MTDSEKNYQAYLREAAKICRCCIDCSQVPCSGSITSGFCDRNCTCDHDDYPDFSEEFDGFGDGTCRVCGCTDNQACDGGCYWVEPDLCSKCAGGTHEHFGIDHSNSNDNTVQGRIINDRLTNIWYQRTSRANLYRRVKFSLNYWLFRKWWPEKCHGCGKRFKCDGTDDCLPF